MYIKCIFFRFEDYLKGEEEIDKLNETNTVINRLELTFSVQHRKMRKSMKVFERFNSIIKQEEISQ